jgi:hypothetical protein
MLTDISPKPKVAQSVRKNHQTDYQRIAELVDNAIDAKANEIKISTEAAGVENSIKAIEVADNGKGMNEDGLENALSLGSDSDDVDVNGNPVEKLGGFGGALKSSIGSKQQISTHMEGEPFLTASYDVKEILKRGFISDIKPITERDKLEEVKRKLPKPKKKSIETGTLIRITDLDLLKEKKESDFTNNLVNFLGETFRYYLQKGITISVNGVTVKPISLFVDETEAIIESDERVILYDDNLCKVKVRVGYIPDYDRKERKSLHKLQQPNIPNQGFSVLRYNRQIVRGVNLFETKSKVKHNSENRFRGEVFIEGYEFMSNIFQIPPTKNAINIEEKFLDQLWEMTKPLMEKAKERLRTEKKKAGVGLREKEVDKEVSKLLNKEVANNLVIAGSQVKHVDVNLIPVRLEDSKLVDISNPNKEGVISVNIDQTTPFYEIFSGIGNQSRALVLKMWFAMKKARVETMQEYNVDSEAMRNYEKIFTETLKEMISKEEVEPA